ncbi:MAG: DUF805 domain-containing protein [Caulobacteraceae bacterium]|nr:MAG: DUF805 domain-containing protein [Caulobacteraceae bacterium]
MIATSLKAVVGLCPDVSASGGRERGCVDDLIQTFDDNRRGRAGRKEFWIGFLIITIANVVLAFALGLVGVPTVLSGMLTLPVWLYYAGRRLHDLGLAGWFGLIPFGGGVLIGVFAAAAPMDAQVKGFMLGVLPLVLTVAVVLWLGCARGQDGANRFGLPPGASEPADVF